jgi:membrane-associated protein
VSYLSAFHGTIGAVVLCALLFAEETGVPLPLAPGDLILVAAGLLIAAGNLSPWVFVPLAIGATSAGAFVGYTWTRALGAPGLQTVARRLGIARHVDRLSARLQSTGPAGIMVCRLLPGLRVTTTLVAGAVGVQRRSFLLGVVPAIVIWVLLFTSLGLLAGVPVAHFLSTLDRYALQGAVLILVGGLGYLAARHVPALRGTDDGLLAAPGPWRIALAVALDLGTVTCIIAGLDLLARVLLGIGGIDDWVDATTTAALTVLAYLVVTRAGAGLTAGEALFRVTYRARRWRRHGSTA